MITNGNYLDKSDQELVVLALGQKENYRYLMQRYEGKLRRYIVRLSGLGQEDAEDILQEVFIKVYRNLNDFDQKLKFSSWIYRITHNETVTFLRKKHRKFKIVNFELEPSILNTLKDDLDIEEDAIKKNLSQDIVRIINKQP